MSLEARIKTMVGEDAEEIDPTDVSIYNQPEPKKELRRWKSTFVRTIHNARFNQCFLYILTMLFFLIVRKPCPRRY